MLDIQFVRDHPDTVDQLLNRRGYEACAQKLIELDATRRHAITHSQNLQAERNEASKKIGQAKAQGNEDEAKALMEKVSTLKESLHQAEQDEREHNDALNMALAVIPNLPLEDIPVGTSEDENVVAREVGETKATEGDLQHFEIGEALGMMEFDLASKLSGARFVLLRSDLARLERALGSFMLDLHTQEFGYEEISAPMLVRDEALFGTGQLPKFKDDLFKTDSGLWLIPTAEVPLTNIVRERIIAAEDLPLRMTALTSCFRSEAGSAGRDTRGMIRLHQFPKVELVSIVDAEAGLSELDRMTNCAEEVLKRLGLSYRVMLLCTGDMGVRG